MNHEWYNMKLRLKKLMFSENEFNKHNSLKMSINGTCVLQGL